MNNGSMLNNCGDIKLTMNHEKYFYFINKDYYSSNPNRILNS